MSKFEPVVVVGYVENLSVKNAVVVGMASSFRWYNDLSELTEIITATVIETLKKDGYSLMLTIGCIIEFVTA